jgi:hypothetical protein
MQTEITLLSSQNALARSSTACPTVLSDPRTGPADVGANPLLPLGKGVPKVTDGKIPACRSSLAQNEWISSPRSPTPRSLYREVSAVNSLGERFSFFFAPFVFYFAPLAGGRKTCAVAIESTPTRQKGDRPSVPRPDGTPWTSSGHLAFASRSAVNLIRPIFLGA